MDKRKTILYIDDEPINIMVFKELFSSTYNVVTATSGLEGIGILRAKNDITVVISDMKMPNMNGLEFIKKAKIEYPQIAYFILSGYNITEEIADALNSKLILKYFCKPLNVREIRDSINEIDK
jgi:two-component system response regulator (stage 0 sporulation protein F)